MFIYKHKEIRHLFQVHKAAMVHVSLPELKTTLTGVLLTCPYFHPNTDIKGRISEIG